MIWRRLNIVGGGIWLKYIMVICLLANWCWWMVFYVDGNSNLIKWLFWRVIKTNKVASKKWKLGRHRSTWKICTWSEITIDQATEFFLQSYSFWLYQFLFKVSNIEETFYVIILVERTHFTLSVTFVSPIPLVLPKKRTPKSSTAPSVIWMYIMP